MVEGHSPVVPPPPSVSPTGGAGSRSETEGGSAKTAAPAAARDRALATQPPSDPPAPGHLPRGGDSKAVFSRNLSPRTPLAVDPPVLAHRLMPQRIDQRFIASEQMLDPVTVAGERRGAIEPVHHAIQRGLCEGFDLGTLSGAQCRDPIINQWLYVPRIHSLGQLARVSPPTTPADVSCSPSRVRS